MIPPRASRKIERFFRTVCEQFLDETTGEITREMAGDIVGEVPTSLPGHNSVARIPAWNEPSPRNPSFERHDLTAKHALIRTNSTILGGMASAREGCVSNASVIAVFRPRRMVCREARRFLPELLVAEPLVAL